MRWASHVPLAALWLLVDVAGVPGPSTLHFRSVEIAQKIQLRCPAINAGLWLRRYVDELDLPEASIRVCRGGSVFHRAFSDQILS